MKVLFIAQGESIHTVNWISLVKCIYPEAEISVFSSSPFGYNPWVSSVASCVENGSSPAPNAEHYWESLYFNPRTAWSPNPARLAEVIRDGNFDLIHVHAMQEGGYLLNDALETGLPARMPRIVLTIMGNDLYYFGRVPAHYEQIRKALRWFHCVQADTQRDILLAQHCGFTGEVIPESQLPYSVSKLEYERKAALGAAELLPAAQRKTIFLMGSGSVRGRSFLVLPAFKSVPDSLKQGVTVKVVGCRPIDIMAGLDSPGVQVEFLPFLDRQQLFRVLAESRVLVSLNKTDGTPKLFLEAGFMGCYPVFSTDTGLSPFILQQPGLKNIALVNPDDIHDIAAALTEVLSPATDLQPAVQLNMQLVRLLLDDEKIVQNLRTLYQL